MMLTRVISIKNVGRFRNSAHTPNPPLAKYTLIYGADGYGKTTLCSVLRSIESGDPPLSARKCGSWPLREQIPRTLNVQCRSFLRTRLCQWLSLRITVLIIEQQSRCSS
jgi:hypothetical protein